MDLIFGDCKVKLKELEDNSIDAIVTDPPYGLSFMGKKWDYDVPSMEIWKECLRVLKPGGYLLAFAGTRTQHRMAVNIEDAGFEIRDMIAWVYGSGFPKSLNIGKAVDKLQGNEREDLGYKKLNPRDKKVYAPKSESAFTLGQKEKGIEAQKLTKGTSDWEGWGTALKPALEPITVARKPLSEKTVADNCLKWGVGGINIDGCRVDGKTEIHSNGKRSMYGGNSLLESKTHNDKTEVKDYGRFPANLIHDGSEEVVELFPECKQANDVTEFKQLESMRFSAGGQGVKPQKQTNGKIITASAARFFYCAKASKKERNIGCEGLEKGCFHPTVKPIALMEYLVKLVSREGQVVLDPFMGSGTTGMACKKLNREFIGIEMMPEYMEIAKARINGVEIEGQLKLGS